MKPSKKPSKKLSLVSQLKKLPPSRQCKNPMANLDEDDQTTWEELKSAIKSGALNHLSLNEIHRQVCDHFNITMPRSTFRDLLVREGVAKPEKKRNG